MLLFSRSRRAINPIRTLSTIPNHTMYPTLSQTPYANFAKIASNPSSFKDFLNTLTGHEQNYVFETIPHLTALMQINQKHIAKIGPRIKYLKMKIDKLEPIPNTNDLGQNILEHLYEASTYTDGNFVKTQSSGDVITVFEKFIEILQSLNDTFEKTDAEINKIAEEQYCLMIPLSIRENDPVFDPRPNIDYTRVGTNSMSENKIICSIKYARRIRTRTHTHDLAPK